MEKEYQYNEVLAFAEGDNTLNTKNIMYGYLAYYNGKRLEIFAKTSYEALQLAARGFGVSPKKAYKVAVVLVEKDGKLVVHSTTSL